MKQSSRALMALLMAWPAAAFAQTRASETDEIVVTAPLDRARSDLAQGISVLDRQDTLSAPIGGLGETLESQPGISSSFFGAGASRPIIRGLGEDRIRILSNGVGVIDASAVSPDHATTSEGLEAERIEVLRGPAALAYGGNAVGGVINVIDNSIAERRPADAFSARLYAGLAGGLNSAAAAGESTFARGAFVFNFNAFTRDSGDFDIPGYADAHAAEEIAGGADPAEFARGEAPNSFSEAHSLGAGVSIVGADGFIGASVKRYETLYGIPEAAHAHEDEEEEGEALFAGPRIDMAQTRYDARAGWERPFWLFERAHAALAIVDYTHAEIEETGEIGTLFSNEGWEARVEAHHRPHGNLTGAWGFSAFSKDFAAVGDEAFISPTTTEEWGAFGVERLELGAFSLEGGLRYDQRTLDNADAGERDFDLVSASVSGGWRPRDALYFGLTLARTERAPTDVELFAFGPHLATQAFEIGDANLDKEIATTIEAAARWQGARWRVEASLYRAEFSDFIALIATGDEEDELPVYQFTQTDAHFVGGEIEARYDLFDWGGTTFSVDGSYDWVRGEFDEGGNLPRIPPASLTLGLAAEGGMLGGRIEFVDVAAQDDVAALEERTAGYALWNAQLRFQPVAGDERLSFLIDGRNLTDEEARAHASFVKDLLPRPGRSIRFAILSQF
ncbi:MAG: TonB-dependent receptor [Hyphomonadaceae bacterium]